MSDRGDLYGPSVRTTPERSCESSKVLRLLSKVIKTLVSKVGEESDFLKERDTSTGLFVRGDYP